MCVDRVEYSDYTLHVVEERVQTRSQDIYKTLSAPLDVQVEITTLCNEACLHCYNFWRGEQFRERFTDFSDKSLRKDQIPHIITELIRNQVFGVTFTGGEPFLYQSTVIEGIKLAREGGLDCSLNSNLTTITSSTANQLKEAGVGPILTSLHSFDEVTHDAITQRKGSLKRALRGIGICQEAGLNVAANMVITRTNQDQIFETGKFVKGLGIKTFSATKATPCLGGTNFSEIGVNREAFKQMLEDLLRLEKDEGMDTDVLMAYPLCGLGDIVRFGKFVQRSCGAGVTTCTIGADGKVRPCSFADESYGNLFSEPLSQIWHKMKDWRDGSRLPKVCVNECQYFPQCGAGCRMEAKFAGDQKGMDPLATKSSDVVCQIPVEFNVMPPDFWERKLQLTRNLRLRKEVFGGIIAPQKRSPTFLNNIGYQIIQRLQELAQPFFLRDTERIFNLSRDSEEFFYMLNTKGVLQEV